MAERLQVQLWLTGDQVPLEGPLACHLGGRLHDPLDGWQLAPFADRTRHRDAALGYPAASGCIAGW
ncbi:MAG TPA: hypothetical protein VG184_01710 [Acidimicrobiales bacterium]|nr:hypothetical protein [Acidimicrobiales bacterium]